jgi:trimeric autotransporter adhesin
MRNEFLFHNLPVPKHMPGSRSDNTRDRAPPLSRRSGSEGGRPHSFLTALLFSALLLASPHPANATVAPQPGDACTAGQTGYFTTNAGTLQTPGLFLVCDGAHWNVYLSFTTGGYLGVGGATSVAGQVMFVSAGKVGIGTAIPRLPFQTHLGADENFGVRDFSGATQILAHNDALTLYEPLRIDGLTLALNAAAGTGNVGIGTAVPLRHLDISNADADTTFTPAIRLANTTTGNDGITGIEFAAGWAGVDAAKGALIYRGDGLSFGRGDFEFLQYPTPNGAEVGLANVVMIINNAGYVGIGTTTPATMLDVAGTVRVADGGETCSATVKGGIRYTSVNSLQYCNASTWQTISTSGGASAAAGANTQVQFNSGGALLGASANFTFTLATGTLKASKYDTIAASGVYKIGGTTILAFADAGADQSSVAVGQLALNAQNDINKLNVGVGYSALQANQGGYNDTSVGAYSSYNLNGGHDSVAVGKAALFNGGTYDTAVGSGALSASGPNNSTALGYDALNAETGSPNTAVGFSALQYATTGAYNTAIGDLAMQGVAAQPLTTSGNVAVGESALYQIQGGAQYNTAVGGWVMQANTTGAENTAYGNSALFSNVTGNNNTAIGYYALLSSTGSTNSGFGYEAGEYISTGIGNTAVGNLAMQGVSGTPVTGNENTAVGDSALNKIEGGANNNVAVGNWAMGNQFVAGPVTGQFNVAVGVSALNNASTGSANVAVGFQAGGMTTGSSNIAIGTNALMQDNSANNTAVGYYALENETAGTNTAVGYDAGDFISTGSNNTAIGNLAMQGISGTPLTGNGNTALGDSALLNIQGAAQANIAVGFAALYSNTTGIDNTAIGYEVLASNATGSNNTAIGYEGLANTTGSNNTAVGWETLAEDTSGGTNTGLGYKAGYAVTGNGGNTLVGYEAGLGVTGGSNIILGEDPSSAITSGSSNILIGNSLTHVTNTTSSQLDIGDAIYGTLNGTPSITVGGNLTVTGTCTGCGGGSATLNGITAATAPQGGIANGNNTILWNWDALANGAAMEFSTNGTAAGNGQKMLQLNLQGANTNATVTSYGAYISNTHTGSASTNVGLYATASGGTNNYAAILNGGNVGIGTAAPGTSLVVSKNAANLPAAQSAGTVMQLGAADNSGARIQLDGFGAGVGNALVLRMARGTAASPTATQAGDELGRIVGEGYGTTGYSSFTGSVAGIAFGAADNWTDTDQGTYLAFLTAANGGTTASERMRIDQNGNVGIGTATPANLLTVNGSSSSRIIASTTNANSSGIGEVSANNDNGNYIEMLAFGSAYASVPAQNAGAIVASKGLTFETDASTSTGGADGIAFLTGGYSNAAAAYISSGGNVGIGTTAPGYALTVAGNGVALYGDPTHYMTWTYNGAFNFTATGTGADSGFNTGLGATYFRDGVSNLWNYGTIAKWGASPAAFDTGLTRNAAGVLEVDNGTAGTLATLVASRVGIGTTTPGAVLEVNGTGKFDGAITMGASVTMAGAVTAGSRTITASGAVTVSATTDYYICINKTVGGATTVNLPASPNTGQIFLIKDCKGDAGTNNITITPASGTIDGASTYVMGMNYQAVGLQYNGSSWGTN